MVRCLDRLPREAVGTPYLEIFKARLDGAMDNCNRGLDLDVL